MVGIAIDQPGGLAGVVVMSIVGLGLVGAGIFWWRFVRSNETSRRGDFEEKDVLLVAARHGGAVTVAQIVLESNLSADRADAVLARMRQRGLAHAELLDDGTVQYRFGGLIPPPSAPVLPRNESDS
jgi:hypothetical protein